MRAVVVGAGPVGSVCAMGLARRGHEVTLVDRDPGPAGDGTWRRKGVMQFGQPHAFRHLARNVLAAELPDVLAAVVAAGALEVHVDGAPPHAIGLQARRSTVETAIWGCLGREPGLSTVIGSAQRLVTGRGRVTGVVVDGVTLDADLVVVASGRAGAIGDEVRGPAEGGACGFSYVSRMYRGRAGDEVPRRAIPIGALYRGYQTIVFPQDANTLCALVIRPSVDEALAHLRHNAVFDAVAPTIPGLAPWVDPERFEPITDVRAGAGLTNAYRGQLDAEGRPTPGVVFVGDAVCTTNPAGGRGVSLGLLAAQQLLALIDGHRGDVEAVAIELDTWCTERIRPWFADHVYWDATLLDRLSGADIDIEAPVASDVVVAAASVDPSLFALVMPFLAMEALPTSLDPARERVRDLLRGGWRPEWSAGPSAAELATDVERALVDV